ncbi:hypothetical protein THOE12_20161 [Vibrio rotiferianus]|nr:hypothetical protein THOE12_20161 [Vibrio rotiferianus]
MKCYKNVKSRQTIVFEEQNSNTRTFSILKNIINSICYMHFYVYFIYKERKIIILSKSDYSQLNHRINTSLRYKN